MKKFSLLFVILLVILAAMLAVAAPGLAQGSCVYNPQHGWHIVGGGENNDHWYETEEECLIALQVPTALATLQASLTPENTATDAPVIVDTVTLEPTSTDVAPTTVTETSEPTLIPTNTPTDPPIVITDTPSPIATEEAPIVITSQPVVKRINSCEKNWKKIVELTFKDEGYRFFEHHTWCKTWLMIRFGINYDLYKATHP